MTPLSDNDPIRDMEKKLSDIPSSDPAVNGQKSKILPAFLMRPKRPSDLAFDTFLTPTIFCVTGIMIAPQMPLDLPLVPELATLIGLYIEKFTGPEMAAVLCIMLAGPALFNLLGLNLPIIACLIIGIFISKKLF